MAKFAYRIRDPNSEIMEGVLEANSEELAQKYLTDRQYAVLSLKDLKERKTFQEFLDSFNRVDPVQFNFFVRQMATMLKAGVPMLPTLMTLSEGIKDPLLKKTIHAVYADIEKGISFSEAISKYPRTFNPLFCATVRSGEAIGELDTVLARLAEILAQDYQNSEKIKAALRYPIFAIITMIVAFLVATLFIIPRFKIFFENLGGTLPLPTRILMGTSEIVVTYWYFALFTVFASAIAAIVHYRTEKGKRFWHGMFLKTPVFGMFVRNGVYSKFARMLGLMLKSGVNILQGFSLLAEIVGNTVISDAILKIKANVEEGETIASTMKQTGVFPILLVQIVHVGEESGKMDELLIQIAEFYDAELEVMMKNIESMIEPFFIVFLGIFVGVMAMGIFLPMWNVLSLIQQS